jgi:hypothetical protein
MTGLKRLKEILVRYDGILEFLEPTVKHGAETGNGQGMMQRACIGALLSVALSACTPTYPSGVVRGRGAALVIAMQKCGDLFKNAYDVPAVDLDGNRWRVHVEEGGGFSSVILDARNGNIIECRSRTGGGM